MTDKELIQKEIDKIQFLLDSNKATGRSYRQANQIIDEFWNMPIGTEIPIIDHSGTEEGTRALAKTIAKRLDNDFPNVQYKLYSPRKNIYIIERISKNFKEQAKEHLEKWKQHLVVAELAEMNKK